MPLEVKVEGSATGQESIRLWKINVSLNETSQWTVSHRFSDFATLRNLLSHSHSKVKIPSLSKTLRPSFMPGSRDNSEQFLLRRKNQLSDFMDAILAHPALSVDSSVLSFLGIVDQRECPTENLHVLQEELMNFDVPNFGVNAFHYDAKHQIIISAARDPNLLSRVGTRISNPFAKQTDEQEAIGALCLWNFSPRTQSWFIADHMEFLCPVRHVLRIHPLKFLIGLSDGYIVLLGLNEAMKRMETLSQLKIHSQHVMGLCFNQTKSFFLSCSSDKKLGFGTIDIKTNTLESKGSVQSSNHYHLLDMHYVPDKQLCFIGTQEHAVLVYAAPSIPPACIQVIMHPLSSPITKCFFKNNTLLAVSGAGCVTAFTARPPPEEKKKTKAKTNRQKAKTALSANLNKRFRMDEKVKGVFGDSKFNAKVTALHYANNGMGLFVGYSNGSLVVYGQENDVLLSLKLHHGAIMHMEWDSDRRRLITSGFDGRLRLWSWPAPETEMESISVPIVPTSTDEEFDFSRFVPTAAGRAQRILSRGRGNNNGPPTPTNSGTSYNFSSPVGSAKLSAGSRSSSVTAKQTEGH